MFAHRVAARFRIVVMISLCSTASMALVSGPDARAQAPDPAEPPGAAADVDDAVSGAAPAAETEPGEAASGSDASGAPAPAEELPESHRKALALLAEGNRLAEELLLLDAIDKYREALTYWDHPITHYNLARLLKALDRTLEAYASVERALQPGPAALSDDPAQAQQIHAHLLGFRDQLRARLVEIRISSEGPDVEVSIGNQTVATAPARPEMFLPGTHRLAAQAPGHRPLLHTMALDPGAAVHLHLSSRRAFTPWKPWALTGAASAVALAGFGLYWHGRTERDALAGRIEAQCRPSCTSDRLAGFDDDWQRVRTLQRAGIGTLITGGSAVLLGAGLVLWNQRRELRLVNIDERPVSILPVASPEMTGLVGATTF
jgi:hypothetical protein